MLAVITQNKKLTVFAQRGIGCRSVSSWLAGRRPVSAHYLRAASWSRCPFEETPDFFRGSHQPGLPFAGGCNLHDALSVTSR
jgi:hypothetical protein